MQTPTLISTPKPAPREGALLPETYKFQRGDSRDKLLQKMARDQKQFLEDVWRRRASDLPLSSPYDLVTMASIVEKETGKAEERPRVASVFINRLRKHMRLQSDPTIVYGLVGGQGPLGRPLTRNDIDTASPYTASWTATAVGRVGFTAVATDTAGLSVTSSVVNVVCYQSGTGALQFNGYSS